VIDACWAMGDANPILSIHDVGAGGLSNALPELAHSGGVGASFDLRKVPIEEPGMSPMQIWSNEAQERYVLAIDEARLEDFTRMCERERCPFAVVGKAREDHQLRVDDPLFGNAPVDMPLDVSSASRRACIATSAIERRPAKNFRSGRSIFATLPIACSGCRRWPTRLSSSPSAIAAWAASACATRW
jgi:phosphoribosylformylglycinamidine (FGAM) synthase-like enzyme